MKTFKIVLTIIIISNLFLNCRTNTKSNDILDGEEVAPVIDPYEESEAKEDSILLAQFVKNYKTKPKIFLKFWSGMNDFEYERVCDTLKKDGVLFGDRYYNLEYYESAVLEKIIRNDLIVGFKLTIKENKIDWIYSLYQKKYNLPYLNKIIKIYSKTVQNNKYYKPVRSYHNGEMTVEMPDTFIDDEKRLPTDDIYTIDVETDSSNFIKVLPKDKIVISLNSDLVIFEQTISKNTDKRYSVETSQKYKSLGYSVMIEQEQAYLQRQTIRSSEDLSNPLNRREYASDFIPRNSTKIFTTKSNTGVLTVTYIPKKVLEEDEIKAKVEEKKKQDSEKSYNDKVMDGL